MQFEFVTAPRIIFGPGSFRDIGSIATSLGRHALIITGRNPKRADILHDRLRDAGVSATTCSVSGEPDLETIRSGVALARNSSCDLVISFGGGSALDAGKAIAAMLANQGDLLDYL